MLTYLRRYVLADAIVTNDCKIRVEESPPRISLSKPSKSLRAPRLGHLGEMLVYILRILLIHLLPSSSLS